MARCLILALLAVLSIFGCSIDPSSNNSKQSKTRYPAIWFAPINDPTKPDWEILPQEAKAGEVILSKRILSNFAGTPFELYGKRRSELRRPARQ